MQDLVELEKQGWRALSSEGEAGRRFYRSILRDDAVMLFPGGFRLEGRQEILASLSAQPWQSWQIEAAQVIALTENASALAYRVTARRQGSEPYVALVSSTYVRSEGEWKLVLHQQTPV